MRYIFFTLVTLVIAIPNPAQEGLNLPTELFVLLNSGQVERYGLGAEGVQTVTSDEQFVIDFGVSPDGGWLAYRTAEAIVISEVLDGGGSVLVLSPPLPPVRGEGATIAWSPDAKAVAYTTEIGLRVHFRLVEPPLTPTSAEVTDSFQGGGFAELSWSPDGRFLAARSVVDDVWQVYEAQRATLSDPIILPPSASAAWLDAGRLAYAPLDGGLQQINLAVGNARSQIAPTNRQYDRLTRLPNGRLAAFSRSLTATTTPGEGRYTLVNPVGGQVNVIGEADIPLGGLRWSPSGELIVAFRGGQLALVNPTSGEGFPLPIAQVVAYNWGQQPLPQVAGYPAPANLFFVGPDDDGVQQVWQLFQDGTPPVPLTQAPDDVVGYAISPDGFSVAYGSAAQLWLQRLNDNSDPVPLAGLASDDALQIDFSSDGNRLAYSSAVGIMTVPVSGGEPTVLLENNIPGGGEQTPVRLFDAPRYAPNFGAMLVDVIYDGAVATGVLDLNSMELREFPYGYVNASWLYDGNVLTYAADTAFTQGGVQVTNLNNLDNPEVRLPNDVSVAHAVLIPRRWREDVRLLLAPRTNSGPTPLRVYDFREGAGLVPVLEAGFADAPQLSPDGTAVAGYTRTRLNETGYRTGQLTLITVATGEQVALRTPPEVSQLRWQR